jgi:predicted transcriptional regulator
MRSEYKKILKIIEKNPDISVAEIAEKIGKTRQGIYWILNTLVVEGYIDFHKTRFKLKKSLDNVK